MRLNINSWHYKFWLLNFSGNEINIPNNNFCDYFWNLILAVILIPFTWVGLVCGKIYKNSLPFWLNLIPTICLYGISCLAIILIKLFYEQPKIMSITSGFMGTVILLSYIILRIIRYFSYKNTINTNISEITIILKEGFLSFKGKYCPKISWISENKS